MDKQSKFLPDRVSGALKSLIKRITGGALLAIGIWALVALFLFDPYLDGFAVASTFGEQSVMGQVVGFLRYSIGFIPAVFMILCIARWGITWLAGWNESLEPEY